MRLHTGGYLDRLSQHAGALAIDGVRAQNQFPAKVLSDYSQSKFADAIGLKPRRKLIQNLMLAAGVSDVLRNKRSNSRNPFSLFRQTVHRVAGDEGKQIDQFLVGHVLFGVFRHE